MAKPIIWSAMRASGRTVNYDSKPGYNTALSFWDVLDTIHTEFCSGGSNHDRVKTLYANGKPLPIQDVSSFAYAHHKDANEAIYKVRIEVRKKSAQGDLHNFLTDLEKECS